MNKTTERIINMRDYGNKCPMWAFRTDRKTPYGNRFKIGNHTPQGIRTRERSCREHRDWLHLTEEGKKVLEQFLREWDGEKPLACWCVPLACHCNNFLEVWDERKR